jgi:hypothetical protein
MCYFLKIVCEQCIDCELIIMKFGALIERDDVKLSVT